METTKLRRFAQYARRSLMEQVSTKLGFVLADDSPARRENPAAVADLQKQISESSQDQVVEKVAYTWFNRFCALRFMDMNGYTRIRVVSPVDESQFQPEILAEAKAGHIDEEMVADSVSQRISALLSGSVASRDPQQEAYRLLVVAACNDFHRAMPYLFERISDYTELLMPDDLLSGNSILAYTREAMTPDACQDVEVIGWLYQFYISEKKDEVFEGLKKNKKITPENIPAATQLFTPHWIVRYLVENSLGRLWMQNHPQSRLVEKMPYYIKPVESGEWEVGSGQCGAANEREVNSEESDDVGLELSRIDRLAKGDGSGGTGLPGNQGIPKGGAVRINQSSVPSSSIDSLQHSGRPSAAVDSGLQELSINRARLQSGSGNADTDLTTSGLHISTTGRSNTDSVRGNQTNDLCSHSEAGLTSHSSLPTSHLRISSPEEIRICDPACGSGHMLTYAFDLLYAIYEEVGIDPNEIPEKILTHNLFGIEIDERAGELAAFALTMKARAKQRRFFNKGIRPNICVLQRVKIEQSDLDAYIVAVGRDLFTANLRTLLSQFDEADNFGSLIRPVPLDFAELRRVISEKGIGDDLLLEHVHHDVLRVLEQAEYLSQRYQVVVANPPYMGGKGMNGRLGAWAKDKYPDSKSDLFAMFIERNLDLVVKQGSVGMITMQSWMFLSSYEKLRSNLLNDKTLTSMAHLGAHAFDSIGGEVVSTTAFVLENAHYPEYKGAYIRLVDGNSEAEKEAILRRVIL